MVVDSPQDEFLTTLSDLFRLHVLLQELVIAVHFLYVLAKVAQEIIQEVVECLQEVSMILNLILHLISTHSCLDIFVSFVLEELRHFKHMTGLLIPVYIWFNTVQYELHL